MEVLVPVDGSDSSARAVEFALRFAAHYDAHLDLVHISDQPTAATEQVLAEAEERVAGTDATVQLVLSDDIGFRPGSAVGEEISRLVEERGYDHVVMGHEGGDDAVDRFIVGSAAEAVRRTLTVPATIVP